MQCCGKIPVFRRFVLPPSSGWSEDGGSMYLRNVGILPQHCMASQASRPRLESSWPWKPQISHKPRMFAYPVVYACAVISFLFALRLGATTKRGEAARNTNAAPRYESLYGIRKIKERVNLCLCLTNTTPWRRSGGMEVQLHALTSALDGGKWYPVPVG
jgi:hypothetical protein